MPIENKEAKSNPEVKEIRDIPASSQPPINSVNEQANLMKTNADSTVPEKVDPEWEIDEHLHNYRFFFSLGLKAVGLFFVIIGGMLSIIGRDTSLNKEVLKFLFVFSFVMSVIMFLSFIVGGWLWRDATNKIRDIANLRMRKAPDFMLLTWLLWLYGTAILAAGIALLVLLNRLV